MKFNANLRRQEAIDHLDAEARSCRADGYDDEANLWDEIRDLLAARTEVDDEEVKEHVSWMRYWARQHHGDQNLLDAADMLERLHTQTREDRKEIDSLRKIIATENHASIDQHIREVKRAELAERQRDRLEVIATKWCDRNHHDWEELTKIYESRPSTTTGEE